MFDQPSIGWEIYLSSGFAWCRDKRPALARPGTHRTPSLVFPPGSGQDVGVWGLLTRKELRALPETLDADGRDARILVLYNPVGGVTPHPIIGISGLGCVVLPAGVNDESVSVNDLRPHADSREMTHWFAHIWL